jgi:hypothetical protein
VETKWPATSPDCEVFQSLTHFSTVIFYGLRISGCKTARFCATRCDWLLVAITRIRDAVQ